MENSELSDDETPTNSNNNDGQTPAIDESRLSTRGPRKIVVHELPKRLYRTPGKPKNTILLDKSGDESFLFLFSRWHDT